MGESKLVILVADGVSAPGRLLCNRLASAGHILFAGYPSPQSENIEYEAGVTPLALDISSDNSVAAAITQITKATQRIDIVINNVRTALFGALEAVHICDAENFINEMLIGTVRLQNAVLPLMRAQGCGRVINVSTQQDAIEGEFTGWQSVAVAALEKLAEIANAELAGTGVSVRNQQICLFHSQFARPYLSEIDHRLAASNAADVCAFNRSIQSKMIDAPSPSDEAERLFNIVFADDPVKPALDQEKSKPFNRCSSSTDILRRIRQFQGEAQVWRVTLF